MAGPRLFSNAQEEVPRPRRPRASFVARVARAIARLAALAALLLGLLYLPPVQRALFGRAASWVEERYGIVVRASRVDVDPVALRASVERLTLASAGSADRPFFTAARVTVDAASSVLSGQPVFERVAIVDPSLDTRAIRTRGGDGRPFRGLGPLQMGRVSVENLSLVAGDPAAAEVTVQRLSLEADGDAPGRLRVRTTAPGTLVLVTPVARLPFDALAGTVTLDGPRLAFERVTATSDAARADVTGFLQFATPDPFHLDYTARIDLARATPWWTSPVNVAGLVSLSGGVTGPFTAPAATVRAEADRFAWSALTHARITAEGLVTAAHLRIDTFELKAPTAEARGRGQLAWREADAPSRIAATWRSPRLRQLGPLVDLAPSDIPTVAAQGTAELSWPGFVPGLDGLAGTIRATATSGRTDGGNDEARIRVAGGARQWRLAWEQDLPGATTATADVEIGIDTASFGQSSIAGTLAARTDDAPAAIRRLIDVEVLAPDSVVTVLETGRLDAQGTVSGTIRSPQWHASATAGEIGLAGLRGISAEGEIVVDRTQLDVRALTARAPGSRARLAGIVDFGDTPGGGTFDGVIDAGWAGAPFAPDLWPVGGPVTMAGQWPASSTDAALLATVQAPHVQVAGRPAGPVSGTVRVEDGVVVATLDVPDLGSRVSSTFALSDERPASIRTDFRDADLARVLTIGGAHAATVDGVRVRASGMLEATGPFDDLGHAQIGLRLDDLSGDVRGLPVTLAAPAAVRWTRGVFDAAAPGVSLGRAHLTLAPPVAGDPARAVALSLTAPLTDVIAVVPPEARPPGVTVDGTVTVEAVIPADRPQDAHATASAEVSTLTRDGRAVLQNARVDARLAGGVLDVTRANATVLGAAVTATASTPVSWIAPWLDPGAGRSSKAAGPARLQARVDASLAPVLAAFGVSLSELSGSTRLGIDLQADEPRLDRVRGTVTADDLRMTTATAEFTQEHPSRISVEAGRARIDTFVLLGPQFRADASGGVALAGERDIDLHVSGTGSMTLVDALVAPRVDGSADLDVRVGGTMAQPTFSGGITLRDVSATSPTVRLVLADWAGRLVLTPGGLEVVNLAGQANGGTVSVNGAIALQPSARGDGLRISAQDVFVEYPPGVRSRAAATIAIAGLPDALRISGSLTLLTDPYREPVARMAQMVTAMAQPSRSATPLPAWLGDAALDVTLVAAAPLRLDNSLGRIELVPNLRLVGTVEQPALDGTVQVAEGGRIRLQSRTYELADSRLDFSPADGLVPRLFARGVTRIGEYDVTLRLSGPADAVEASLSSTPPLGERDLQALVLTGQAGESGIRTTESSDRFAVAALSSDLLGMAGQAFGLDSVRIGNESFELVSSDVDPALRLTASKTFRDKFELVFSDNLDDNTYTWILIYRPRSGLELRASSRDNVEATLEFRQRLSFGPGGARHSSPDARIAAERPREVVYSAAVTGEPPDVVTRLGGLLALQPGQPFEYRRWMEDVDRLRKFYFDTGYLAARVVPTRKVFPSSGAKPVRVALGYRVTRGPSTRLVVEGYDADAELVARLRTAWFGTAFDQFADEDITRAVRDVLVDRGFVAPDVRTAMSMPSAGAVLATVSIRAGPRPSTRLVEFSGMAAVMRGELDRLVEPPPAKAEAWRDPASLCAAVTDLYAARGYRSAKVTSAPVRIDGDTAFLPIRIEEGVLTTLSHVTIAGADPAREPSARTAAALAEGAVLKPGDERLARLRIERFYRDLGFRDATAAARVSPPDAAGRRDVTFTIKEGRPYVVSAVRLQGLRTTRRSAVDRAVAIKPGDAAGQAALADTQRRLYQIGTFNAADVRLEPASAPVPAAPAPVPVDAVVSVTEPKRYQLVYGLEYSNQYGPTFDRFVNALGVAADVRDRNLFGRGYSLGAGTRFEPNLKSVRSLFAIPTLRGLSIPTNVFASWKVERDDFESGMSIELETKGVSVEQRWRQRRWLDFSWGAIVDDRTIRLFEEPGAWPVTAGGTLVSLNGAAVVDRRDSALDANRGWFHSSSLQQGIQAIGSDLTYTRYLGRTFYFKPIGRLVSASGVRIGSIWSTKGTAPFSVLDLFFKAGGSQTVRGYKQDELSAANIGSVTLGGTKLLIVNQELRVTIAKWLKGVVFADAGNTFGNAGIRLGELAVGLGFGVRINTPIAPLRIDLGFPVPRRPGDPLFRWHFSIGQMF
jgi:outer membrane protein assembly factor BamA/autotransporter translocation and assembly factor TamB